MEQGSQPINPTSSSYHRGDCHCSFIIEKKVDASETVSYDAKYEQDDARVITAARGITEDEI